MLVGASATAQLSLTGTTRRNWSSARSGALMQLFGPVRVRRPREVPYDFHDSQRDRILPTDGKRGVAEPAAVARTVRGDVEPVGREML